MSSDLPNSPIDRLHLAAALIKPTNKALSEWLEEAMRKHVYAGESVDHVMGFSGALGRTPRFQVLQHHRNDLLKKALVAVGGDFQTLTAEVHYYETRLRSRWRDSPEGDESWGDARRFIHEAFQITPSGVPGTIDGLRKALRDKLL